MISNGGAGVAQPSKDGGTSPPGPIVPEKRAKAKVALALGGGVTCGFVLARRGSATNEDRAALEDRL